MKHFKRASLVAYLMAALIAFVLTGATSSYAAKKTIHFYNDISGSPQMAVDAGSGQVLWKETYKPYGERINNSPASASVQGKNEVYFHGKQQEALNGGISIQYFGARYYDPSIGRFMGVDPVHFMPPNVHSFNRFAYGNNNPYKFVDPDGNLPVWAPLLFHIGGGAAAGAGGAAGVSIASQYLMSGSVQWRGVGGVFDAMSEGAQIGMFLGPTLGAEAGAVKVATQISPKIGAAGGAGAGKRFSENTKDAARVEAGETCVFCKTATIREPGPTQSNIDHAIPKSRGGNNTQENAQNTCRTCNLDKGTSTTTEYLQRLYETAK
jgi:RHS repeat-associated protein